MSDGTTKRLVFHDGRRLASVERGILKRTLCGSRHFLRKPPAISFLVAVLDEAERLGATAIEVRDKETNRIFEITMSDFKAHSFPIDFGFGPQRACPLAAWTISIDQGSRVLKAGEYRQRQAVEPRPAPVKHLAEARQMDLFGGKQ